MSIATTLLAVTKPPAGASDTFAETIQLETGGFLVAWNRMVSAGKTQVLAQRFDAAGKAVGSAIVVQAPDAAGVTGKPQLVDLGAGKTGVVWQVGPDVKSAVITDATGAVTKPVTVFSKVLDVTHDLAVLPGGKFALVANGSTVTPPTLTENEQITILDANLHPVTKPSTFSTHPAQGYSWQEEAIVGNGKGGVAFYVDHANDQLYSKAFGPGGAFGPAVRVNNTHMQTRTIFNAVSFRVQAAELSTGGYVVTWASQENTGNALDYDIRARVFGENGKAIGNDFLVNTETYGGQSNPEVIGLKEGGFAVAWTDDGGLSTRDQNIRYFDAKGVAISGEITTEHYTAFGKPSSVTISADTSYTQLKDGSLVKVFAETSGPVRADGIAKAVLGTTGADTIAGTTKAEVILGGFGSDSIHGNSGNDVIDGYTGNDTLYGDAGLDTLNGGAGTDTLYGGSSADVFVFDHKSAKDTVADFVSKTDQLDVSAWHFGSTDQVMSHAKQVGANVQLDLDANTHVTLLNVKIATLLANAAHDFIL